MCTDTIIIFSLNKSSAAHKVNTSYLNYTLVWLHNVQEYKL